MFNNFSIMIILECVIKYITLVAESAGAVEYTDCTSPYG